MAKQHSKEKPKGVGFTLAGHMEELIKLLVTNEHDRKWARNQLQNEGPKHKQVLTALLCNRLYDMVKAVEKSSGYQFALQEGYELVIETDKESKLLPVPVPVNGRSEENSQKIMEAIAGAPQHEVLAYAMCLQVIEWVIQVKSKQLQ